MNKSDIFNHEIDQISKEELATAAYYEVKPITDAVLSLIPFLGPLISSSIEYDIREYQNSKEQEFVNAILRDKRLITSDMVNNVSFMVNLLKANEAVKRLATNDKVKYFGNLVRNGYLTNKNNINSDTFDEYLSILSDLSNREIVYLFEFSKYSKRQVDRTLANRDWIEYSLHMKELFPGIDPELMLKRLTRTGFVNEVVTWVDLDQEAETLLINSGNNRSYGSFRLSEVYDDFERMIL